jgi:hypothetical protein
MGLGLGLGPSLRGRRAPVSGYDPGAVALFARMTVQPDATRKQLISDRFVAGKAFSFWAKMDALWVHAAHDSQAGRMNWLAPIYDCLPINSPAFTTDRGFMGDGSSSYLDTGFNPSTAVSPKFVQDSGVLGIRSNTATAGTAGSLAGYYDTGAGTGSTINPRAIGDIFSLRLNSAAAINSGGTSMTSVGMFVSSRLNSTAIVAYREGAVFKPSTASTSQVPPNGNFRLGSINSASFRACQFSMGFVGAGLTDQEVLDMFNWFEPYRIAVGVT